MTSPFAQQFDPLTGLPEVHATAVDRQPFLIPLAKNAKRTMILPLPSDAPWIPPSRSGLRSLVLGNAWLEYNITERAIAASVQSTITGASVVSIDVHDPNLKLLNSGLLQQRCRIRFGGFVFELVRVKLTGYVLTLEFEDAVVAELRSVARSTFKTWRPGSISLIGVVRWVLSEKVKGRALPGVRLYAPDDPGGGAATTISQSAQSLPAVVGAQKREPGLAKKEITVRGVPADSEQLDNTNVVLKTIYAYQPRPTTAELVMAVMTINTESSAVNNPGGSGGSAGLFQQLASSYPGLDRTDRVAATKAFFNDLRKITGTPAGSAPAYQGTPLYALIQAVQRSGAGAASNGAANYGPQEGEAKATVQAFLAAEGGDASASGGALGPNVPDLTGAKSGKPKTYHRGQKHTPEDSWSMLQRMAGEVNYRCFVVGDILYFLNDKRLLGSESRLSLNRGTEGVAQLDFDIDVGQRVNKVTLVIDVKAWSTPPGSVISLHDVGPASGDWLVDTVSADLKKPSWLSITLTRPRVPLKETGDIPDVGTGLIGTTLATGAVLPSSAVFSSKVNPLSGAVSAPNTGAAGDVGYPLSTRGKLIGVPYSGTHGKAFNVAGGSDNWESENAVDLGTPTGTPVLAVDHGTIGPEIGSLGAGGRFAGLRVHLVTSDNEFYYAHLSRLDVQAGQFVAAGTQLGLSGEADGVQHLHFAAENGDPRNLINQTA